MSKYVELAGRESGMLTQLENGLQEAFLKRGGIGDWQEVAIEASKKVANSEPLNQVESIARGLAIAYVGQATRIHREVFGQNLG